ncbi:MAG: WHG domain-containing protein [Actinomycetota bacterium]
MSGRRGLTTDEVVDAAVALVEAEGAEALSLSRVARELGVKPPSLYNHVSGLDTLHRQIGLRAVVTIGDRLSQAAMGRAGRDALLAVAAEFRSFATAHPHLYEFSVQARPDDEEYDRASLRAVEPLLAVLRGYGFDEQETIHAARAIRSALHGFVALEMVGGFGLAVDIDRSFEWFVLRLAETFDPPGPPST